MPNVKTHTSNYKQLHGRLYIANEMKLKCLPFTTREIKNKGIVAYNCIRIFIIYVETLHTLLIMS